MARVVLLALLLVPTLAWADPITLVASLAPIVGSAAAGFIVSYGAFIALGALQLAGAASARRKQRRAAARQRAEYNASLQDRNVTALSAEQPWQIVYGNPAPIGGALVAILTSGSKDEFKHLVIVFAAHECQAIDEIYIEGDPVGALDGSGWCTGGIFLEAGTDQTTTESIVLNGSGVGTVSRPIHSLLMVGIEAYGDERQQWQQVGAIFSGTTVTAPAAAGQTVQVSYTYASGNPRVHVSKHLSPGGIDTADGYLMSEVPGYWTSAHRLSGYTYAVVTLDLRMSRFQGGPPNISARLRGKKLYDPRTGTTAYSTNNALCSADYLRGEYGFGADASQIDAAALIAAANACDAQGYTCHGALSTGADRDQSLQQIEDSFAGSTHFSGGVWRIMAGAWSSPVMALTGAHLAGRIEVVQASEPADQRFNGARGQYVSGDGLGVAADITPYTVPDYVTADGVARVQDMSFPFTASNAQCRKLAAIAVERSRLGLTIHYPGHFPTWRLQPGDRVTVTNPELGFAAKPFRLVDWTYLSTAPVGLVLTEDNAAVWTGSPGGSEAAAATSNLIDPWAKPAAPAGLTADSGTGQLAKSGDGTLITRVRVTWAPSTLRAVLQGGYTQLQWRLASAMATEWQNMDLPADAASQYLTGVQDGSAILVRVRHITGLQTPGDWSTLAHQVVGKTAPPPPFDACLVLVQPDGTRQYQFSYAAGNKPADWLGAEIRYMGGVVASPVWESMTPLQDTQTYYTNSPVELNAPLAGTYTFAFRSVDTSGNLSSYVLVTITLPPRRLGNVYDEFHEHPDGWPGSKTGCHVQDGYLEANDATTWATLPATWSAWTRWNMAPTSPIVYQTPARDLGTTVAGQINADVDADGAPVLELSTSADGVSWSAWGSAAATFNARYIRLRLTITATGGAPVPVVRQLSYTVNAPMRSEYLNDVAIAALTGPYRIGVGDIRIPLTGVYSVIKRTTVVVQDGSAGTWTYARIDQSLSPGPRWQFRLNGALADPAFVDFFVEGF